MKDQDITVPVLTVEQISSLEENQLSLDLNWPAGSMDFAHDPGLHVGAADSVFTLGSLSAVDLSGNIDWSTLNPNITLGPLMSDTMVNSSSKITLTGDDADIEINGESVVGVLKEIRDRLGIIQVSEAMEAEWDELRQLRAQYEAKLAECREKSKVWTALAAQEAPKGLT